MTLLIYTNLTRSAATIVKNDFGSKGRSVSDLKVHLVLVTKYRRKAFINLMLTRLQVVMEYLPIEWDCKLIEFSAEEDLVHLLFQYHPEVELSKLVNNLKSISSRKLRQEFATHDRKVLLEGCILEWFLFCLKLWGGNGIYASQIYRSTTVSQ